MIVRRCLCTAAQSRPWLFVGLGNSGDKYNVTRHNVGFEMIDAFAESVGISVDRIHFKALFGQGVVDDAGVFLAKPQTYMNLNGESAGPLAAYHKMPLNRVVVFHDDMDLPCGVLRLQDKGGHGKAQRAEECDLSFSRKQRVCLATNWSVLKWLRIGKPPGQVDPKAFLLQKFNAAGREHGNKSSPLKKTIATLIQEAGPHVNSTPTKLFTGAEWWLLFALGEGPI